MSEITRAIETPGAWAHAGFGPPGGGQRERRVVSQPSATDKLIVLLVPVLPYILAFLLMILW